MQRVKFTSGPLSLGCCDVGVYVQVRATLETLTAQNWVREKCMQHASRLLDPEYLGDTTLTPSQVTHQCMALHIDISRIFWKTVQTHFAPQY